MTIDLGIQLYYEVLNFKFDFNFSPGFLLQLIQISYSNVSSVYCR